MIMLDIIAHNVDRGDFMFIFDFVKVLNFPQLIFSKIYLLKVVEILYSLQWGHETVGYD